MIKQSNNTVTFSWTTLFPIAFISLCLFLYLVFPKVFLLLLEEDGIVEYTQAVLYLTAGVYAFFISQIIRKNIQKKVKIAYIYYILAAVLVFIAFEEVTWGQRLFGLKTPELLQKHNVQGEITIHNLTLFQGILHATYMVVGAYGAFSRSIFTWLSENKYRFEREILTPRASFFLYFFPVLFYYAVFDFIYAPSPALYPKLPYFAQWQEAPELLLSFGLFLFIFGNYKKLAKSVETETDTVSRPISIMPY